MATLIVTFSQIDSSGDYRPPMALGAGCRTETITMPGTGTFEVVDEEVIELLADSDCWVAIGEAPDSTIATDGTGAARPILAGIPYTFGARPGYKIAVAAR